MAEDLPDDVEARADELYCSAPGDFVAARGELVKALRAEGRREEAAAVAKLPKPSLPAWAVNQVVRTQGADVRALWAAGDAVVAAQEAVLAGEVGRDELRAAVEAERSALAPLTQAARGLMSAPGRFLTEPAVQEVVETLHAAALDPGARPEVEAARLARPLRMAGMGAVAGGGTRTPRRADVPAEAEAAEVAPAPPPPPPKPDPIEVARRTEARAAASRADREAEAARRRLARAERDRAAAEERVERARARLREAEDALEAAEDEVDARRAEASRAEDAADAARADAED